MLALLHPVDLVMRIMRCGVEVFCGEICTLLSCSCIPSSATLCRMFWCEMADAAVCSWFITQPAKLHNAETVLLLLHQARWLINNDLKFCCKEYLCFTCSVCCLGRCWFASYLIHTTTLVCNLWIYNLSKLRSLWMFSKRPEELIGVSSILVSNPFAVFSPRTETVSLLGSRVRKNWFSDENPGLVNSQAVELSYFQNTKSVVDFLCCWGVFYEQVQTCSCRCVDRDGSDQTSECPSSSSSVFCN